MLKSRRVVAFFLSAAIAACEASSNCLAWPPFNKNNERAVFFCERQLGEESVCETMCKKINSLGFLRGLFGLPSMDAIGIIYFITPPMLCNIGRSQATPEDKFVSIKSNVAIIIESARLLKSSKKFLDMSNENRLEYEKFIDDSIKTLKECMEIMENALRAKYDSSSIQQNSNNEQFLVSKNDCNIS